MQASFSAPFATEGTNAGNLENTAAFWRCCFAAVRWSRAGAASEWDDNRNGTRWNGAVIPGDGDAVERPVGGNQTAITDERGLSLTRLVPSTYSAENCRGFVLPH